MDCGLVLHAPHCWSQHVWTPHRVGTRCAPVRQQHMDHKQVRTVRRHLSIRGTEMGENRHGRCRESTQAAPHEQPSTSNVFKGKDRTSSYRNKGQPCPLADRASKLHKGCDVEQVMIVGEHSPLCQVSSGIHQFATWAVVGCCECGGVVRLAAWSRQLTIQYEQRFSVHLVQPLNGIPTTSASPKAVAIPG